jgi:type IV pilus assembly protein PilA
MKKTNKGFSLVELIIVIAIMAILAGAIAPALIKYIDKSRKSNDVSSAKTIKTSIETALGNETAYEELVPVAGSDGSVAPTTILFVYSKGGTSNDVDWTNGTVTFSVDDCDKAEELINDSLSGSVPKVKFSKKGAKAFCAIIDDKGVVSVGVTDGGAETAFNTDGDAGDLPLELTPELAEAYQ